MFCSKSKNYAGNNITISEAEKYLQSLKWQYAKTYPSAPHEYTCLAWKPDTKHQMVDFARLIQDEGFTEIFEKREYKILVIGEMKYWTMDFPLENTDLINRTYADDSLKEQITNYVQSPDFKFEKGMSLDNIKNQGGVYTSTSRHATLKALTCPFTRLPNNREVSMKQKIYNALYGAIVADALGVPVEFLPRETLKENPVTDMIGFGTYDLPKGSWSDDSSMMLCLTESIGRLGKIDYDDIMKNFSAWFNESAFTPDNKLFDIGGSCQKAIMNYLNGIPPLDCGPKGENNNGNGSLMRIAPLPLYLFQKYGEDAMKNEEVFDIIHNVSSLTHAHPISLIGCDIYCAFMLEILNGTSKSELLQKAVKAIDSFVKMHSEYAKAFSKHDRITYQNFINLPEDQIKSSGYVVDTLEAALWCFLSTDNYKDCVLKAVNLGSDTDTVACVAGSLRGFFTERFRLSGLKTLEIKRQLIKSLIASVILFANFLKKNVLQESRASVVEANGL